MGTLNNGIAVEFTPETLLRIFRRMTLDERVVKERFREGVFADVYSRGQGNGAVRFVVLWDDGSKEPFLFKLRKAAAVWEVVSVNETCADHRFAEGLVLKRHVKYAADAFYSREREKAMHKQAFFLQPQPAVRSAS